MISTPETGVDSIAVTWALLDPIMTIVRPFSAFITASVTGLAVNLFDPEDKPKEQLPPLAQNTILPMATVNSSDSCCASMNSAGPSENKENRFWEKLQAGMSFSFGTLLAEIGPWLLLGVGLAALISVFLSPDFVEAYMGSGLLSMLMMIALATPLYVCATASTPIAAALALKGLSPGAALVFLLAGPATNVATITVVAKFLGKKTAAIYVISIMLCSLALGLLVNWLYFHLGLSIADWVHHNDHHSHGILYWASAIALLLLIFRPWVTRLSKIHSKKEQAAYRS